MTSQYDCPCLEYLRQSIMCNTETNLEYRVPREDSVRENPGLDVKSCRNFDAARTWAPEWRAFDGKDSSAKHGVIDLDVLNSQVVNHQPSVLPIWLS